MDAELKKEYKHLIDQMNSATTLQFMKLPFAYWFGRISLLLPFLALGVWACSIGYWVLGLMIVIPMLLTLGLFFFVLLKGLFGLRITTNHLIVRGLGKLPYSISAWPNICEFVIVKRRRFFFFSQSLIGIKYKYDIGSFFHMDKQKCNPKTFDYLFPSNFGETPEKLLDMLNSYLRKLA